MEKNSFLCLLCPLWVTGKAAYQLNDVFSCKFPGDLFSFSTPAKRQVFARNLLEKGYDSLILGGLDIEESSSGQPLSSDFSEWIHAITQHGIKIFLSLDCPSFCPKKMESIGEALKGLQRSLPSLAGIFWQSRFLQPSYRKDPSVKDALLSDLAGLELQMLEQSLEQGKELIFYLPSKDLQDAEKQTSWFPRLCDDAAMSTRIAFSTLAGDPRKLSAPLHPFWRFLKESKVHSSTPLLPIANVGSIGSGEGLWPLFPIDLFQQLFSRAHRDPIGGIIALTPSIPEHSSILGGALWITAHAMKGGEAPELLLEKWIELYRPDLISPYFRTAINEISAIAREVEKLSLLQTQEETKLLALSLLSRLDYLQALLEVEERKTIKGSKRPSLYDYYQYFYRDQRRMVLNAMQSAKLTVSGLIKEHDNKESFWTSVEQSFAHGSQSHLNVTLLKEPHLGGSGSRMKQIYEELILKC